MRRETTASRAAAAVGAFGAFSLLTLCLWPVSPLIVLIGMPPVIAVIMGRNAIAYGVVSDLVYWTALYIILSRDPMYGAALPHAVWPNVWGWAKSSGFVSLVATACSFPVYLAQVCASRRSKE